MKPEKTPEVIDFDRYKAAQAQVKAREAARQKDLAKAARQAKGGSEPILGSRPRAGLILVVFILVLAALVFGPRLMSLAG